MTHSFPPPAVSRSLSRRAQLAIVAALALFAAIGVFGVRLVVAPLADQPETAATPGHPGAFTPSKEQLAGLKIATVRAMNFRPERVTEGNIAIDDDLTTPVFSPYSGRVIKLIAKLGDHVERGAPLMAVEATEFVQAQNDLITAASTLKTARSQLSLAQAAEQRQHLLFLGKGAALKDWQQSQADLAAARTMSALSRPRCRRCATGCASSARATRRSPGSRPARRRTWSRSPMSWRRSAAR